MDKRTSLRGHLPRAGLAALIVAGLATSSSALADEVKIGTLLPLTGTLQTYGEAALTGVRLAVEEVNANGGVLGKQVNLVVSDSRSTSQVSIDAAQKLATIENVAGIIGAMASGNTIPVAKSVSATVGVTQIAVGSTSPVITKLGDNDFLFRTAPSDAFTGVALAEVAREIGYSKMAIAYINDDFGRGLNDSFTRAFESMGGKVTGSTPIEQDKASLRGELQSVSGGGPDALMVILHPTDAITAIKQSLENGYFKTFYFPDLKDMELIQNIGEQYLNGSFGVSPQPLENSESFKRFVKAYEKRYGELPPQPYIDGAYDAAMTLMLSIEKAGSTDRKAVRDAMRPISNSPGEKILPGDWAKAKAILAKGGDIDYVGASGSVDYDADGDVKGTFAKWIIEKGKYKTIRVFEPKGVGS
jgi:ABC-type branched-subunit amino acid transport system substrate-binding protein